MQLEEIEISAYRSVVNQKISLNENCIALIGPNESGKTNILKAILSLDESILFNIKDRSKINAELPKVIFTFSFNDNEKKELEENTQTLFNNISVLPNKKIIKSITFQNYSITEYLEKENDAYKNFKNGNTTYDIEIISGLYKQKEKSGMPSDVIISYEEKEYNLSSINFIDKKLLPQDYIQYFEATDVEQIKEIINEKINVIIEKFIPSVIFWEYSNKYLLPSEIAYDEFIKNNDPYNNSAPLYNIFILSKRLNIADENDLSNKINEWKSDSSTRRRVD